MNEHIKERAISNGWEETGQDFGYPQCCIDSFCNGRVYGTLSPEEKQEHDNSVWRKTGYIPCPECMKKDVRIVLKEIDKRRNPKHNTFIPDIIR